jgi:hypothetical protein
MPSQKRKRNSARLSRIGAATAGSEPGVPGVKRAAEAMLMVLRAIMITKPRLESMVIAGR